MEGKEDNKEAIQKYNEQIEIQKTNPHYKAKQKIVQVVGSGTESGISFSNYFVTNFVRDHIVFNKKIAKLPRFLVNPLVKFGLYIEWMFQKYVLKDQHNLHKYPNSFASSKFRLDKKLFDRNTTSQKDRSLRTIVNKKYLENFKQNVEEKVLTSLTAGP